MKKIKDASLVNWMIKSVCCLLFTTVIGCNPSDKPEVENKGKQCSANQTITRDNFSFVVGYYLSRNPDRGFYKTLPLSQLKDCWATSFILFNLFSEDLSACVVEPSGKITQEFWTREGVDEVKVFLDFLKEVISLSNGNQNGLYKEVVGEEHGSQPPGDSI